MFGVSPDPVKSHKKFADKHTLKFTLLADLDHKLAERMGVWQEKQFMGRRFMGVVRSTFVFQKGKLLRLYPNVRVAGHADAVLEDL